MIELNINITLASTNCDCGNRHWKVISETVKAELCGYCRTIRYLNTPPLQWFGPASTMEYDMAQLLLLAEYKESIDKTIRAKIMSIVLGNNNEYTVR